MMLSFDILMECWILEVAYVCDIAWAKIYGVESACLCTNNTEFF